MYSKLIKKLTSVVAMLHLIGGREVLIQILKNIKCTDYLVLCMSTMHTICYNKHKIKKKKLAQKMYGAGIHKNEC